MTKITLADRLPSPTYVLSAATEIIKARWGIPLMRIEENLRRNTKSNGVSSPDRTCRRDRDRMLTFSTKFFAIAVLFFTATIPVEAELNYSIDLTQNLQVQSQWNPSWAAFPIGPRSAVVPGSRVNIGRCGCFITSLSTAAEALDGGGFPWFAHPQFTIGGFTAPAFTFSPKYLDDYFNTGPAPLLPRTSRWAYAGGGGTTCGVAIWPSAPSGFMDPIRDPVTNEPITPTGLTWDTQDSLNAAARDRVDAGLAQGIPTIIGLQMPAGGGHANLIVGWDNTEKKYLIFDPMWSTSRGAQLMGTDWPQGGTKDEKYTNYVNSVTAVMPLQVVTTGSRWLLIKDDPEPIELRMTDPRGRRTGHDPLTGKNIQENSKAFYSEFTSWADPLGLLAEAEPLRYIAARDPEAGVYGLEVFGTGNGPFTLTLETVSPDQPQIAATITGNITSGEIKRYEITYTELGSATYIAVPAFGPRAKAGNDFTAYVGNTVAFDGRGSQQIAGAISSYAWNFGDGTSATGSQQTHAYTTAGLYTATLTVTNSDGLTANDTKLVTVVVPGSQILKETIRVSTTSTNTDANNPSGEAPQVTPDGRYVVFESSASNLVANDTNGLLDIFVKDLATGNVDRVNVATDGTQANNYSRSPAISADGRFISFYSAASNLGPTNNSLFVHDRVTGITETIAQTNDRAEPASLSADGRFITFRSEAALLFGGYGDDVYLKDRQLGNLEKITTYKGFDPHISADGRFVTYWASYGPDHIDSNSDRAGVYIRDWQAGTDELISIAATGLQISNHSFNPSISADGRFVAFEVND